MIVLVVVVGVVLRVREATSSDRPLHQVLLLIRRRVGSGSFDTFFSFGLSTVPGIHQ